MKLGISTASFYTKVVTEDTFSYIKDMNVDLVEVFLSSFCEYEGEILDKIVKNKNIEVHSVHALTNQFEPDLFNKNIRAQEDCFSILEKVLTAGERLGAKYYTFHGATILKKIKYNFDYDFLSKVVSRIMDRAKSHNIELSYETVHWAYFNNIDYFNNLKKILPNLKATLDIKQIMQAKSDYREFLPHLKDSLTTVHLCDYDDNGNLYLPGNGTFDFIELFKRLKDINFSGALIMEVYPQSYKDFSELNNSLNYLRECLDKI